MEAAPKTNGDWESEDIAHDTLEEMLRKSSLFNVYRECWGVPLYSKHFQDHSRVRADLIVTPRIPLIDQGWSAGAIVFEVKRSGEKIGPPLSQMIDYMNSAFTIPNGGGIVTVPTFAFLFSCDKQHGPLASVMAQQHIGTASLAYNKLSCFCGEKLAFRLDIEGNIEIGDTRFGLKIGSR